jgi:hypothetical protein
MLPTTEVEFPGHAAHVSMEVALLAAEYVFAGQEVHIAEPSASLYLPIAHAAHAVCGTLKRPFAVNSANVT